ncbi:hypothetical protein TSAR_000448 [Trichomalopsis sarcophagae]|uniref:Uncharacterized protein n=1 Tax=Trichomalopsis sarcophagae TaxID=543379 RepID=A0A232F8E7_9HYME|nr:hypothetical protein TSAR_000448 [Trichomalopsis sarcophagae]
MGEKGRKEGHFRDEATTTTSKDGVKFATGATGQKAPLAAGQKVAPGGKSAAKPATKPSAQKGQVKVTPKAACVKTGKNKKKGQRQQYDLIVTINLGTDGQKTIAENDEEGNMGIKEEKGAQYKVFLEGVSSVNKSWLLNVAALSLTGVTVVVL